MRELINPWKQLPEYMCIGCSPNNIAGVKMTFYEDGDYIVSVWKPESRFQGWHNTLHGGIQTLLLDEIAAWTIARKLQTTGVTSKLEVRFRKTLFTTDKYMIVRASIFETNRNIAIVKAEITNQKNELCANADCTYFTFSKEKAAEMNFFGCDVTENEMSIEEIINGMQ